MCQWQIEIERELESHDTERSTDAVCLSLAQVAARGRVGTSCMNTVKVSCHGGKIASEKFRR